MSEGNWLDGNGTAGLLEAAFGAEMTNAMRSCASCGARTALGAHRAYLGAGLVLRCPDCEDLAVTIVELPGRHVVQVRGTLRVELPR